MMSRVKLDLPITFDFSTSVVLRIDDMNHGNHLGNDTFVSLMQEAKVRFLASKGFEELDIGNGVGMIQTDTVVLYKSEGFYGNEIEIQIAVRDFSRAGFVFYYQMQNVTTNKLMAEARTGMVAFDYSNRKVVQLPDPFIQAFNH